MEDAGSTNVLVALIVLALIVIPSVAAPLLPGVRNRPVTGVQRAAGRIFTTTALAAVLLLVLDLPIYVFLVVSILNLTIGREEFVPFSVFPMYSQPRLEAINVRVVDPDGSPMRTAMVFDVPPSSVLKLYRHELRSRGGSSSRIDPDLVTEKEAGEGLAKQLLASRRRSGRTGPCPPFRVQLMAFTLDDDGIHEARHLLARSPEQ